MMRKKSQTPLDLSATIIRIQELGIRRRQFIKARIRVLNAAGALIRRYLGWRIDLDEASRKRIAKQASQVMAAENLDKLSPELADAARELADEITVAKEMAAPGEKHQHVIELEMRKLARQFPVWKAWAKDIKGLSDLGLAIIIAEAGNIGAYDNKGKLWKRLGLAPITKDGITKSASSWRRTGGLSADDWSDAGYKPSRRAAIFSQVGTSIIGFLGHGYRPRVGDDITALNSLGHYERVFIDRLRYEASRNPEMRLPDTQKGKESYSKYCAYRAQRYTEKRLIRDLWKAWQETTARVPLKAAYNLSSAVVPARISLSKDQLIRAGTANSDARKRRTSANNAMPRDHKVIADVHSVASSDAESGQEIVADKANGSAPDSSHAPSGAVPAKEAVSKDQSGSAGTKASKARRGKEKAKVAASKDRPIGANSPSPRAGQM